jgi:hypothetical protein
MRTILAVMLIGVCLVVIAVPAFLAVPQAAPALSQTESRATTLRSERDLPRMPFRLDDPLSLLRFGPFGARVEGWQGLLSAAASWVYLYITAALMLVLVPRRVRLITRSLRAGGWRGQVRLLLIGLAAILASVSLSLLARYAFVWFVLIVVLTGAVLLLSFLGLVALSLMAGGVVRRWANWRVSPWLELGLGSLVVFALGRVPFAGWVLFGIVSAWGLGAVLSTHLGSGEAWSLHDWQSES